MKIPVVFDTDRPEAVSVSTTDFLALLNAYRVAWPHDSARADADESDRRNSDRKSGSGSTPEDSVGILVPPAATRAEPPPPLPWAKGPPRQRITSELLADAVDAIAVGHSLEHWMERCRFKGNKPLLSTLVAGVISLNGRPASMAPPTGLMGWKEGWKALTAEQHRQLADRAMGVNETIEGLA